MGEKLLFVASTGAHIRHFHLPYLRQFRKEGWVIHAACGSAENIPYADRVLDLPLKKRMLSLANLRASRILRKQILQERYAAVIVHTSLAAFFTRLAVFGLKDRPKVINMVHGYLFDDRTPLLKRRLLLAAEMLTAPVTDRLITMNRYDYEIAQTYRLGRTVSAVPGVGVDFGELDSRRTGCADTLRRSLGIKPEDFVLIYSAEFSRRKMQDVLLHAMSLLPENAVLLLPGDGKYLATCQALAQKLRIAHRVHFPGHVANIVPWYEMANAAVSASRSEGLPFNIMEAMHFGLPVVASDAKGHTDLIVHEKTGLLYPFGDWSACAGQILRLMEDPQLARSISHAAAEMVAQYGLSSVQAQIMELYRNAICEKP